MMERFYDHSLVRELIWMQQSSIVWGNNSTITRIFKNKKQKKRKRERKGRGRGKGKEKEKLLAWTQSLMQSNKFHIKI